MRLELVPVFIAMLCWLSSFIVGLVLIHHRHRITRLEFALASARSSAERTDLDRDNEFNEWVDNKMDDLKARLKSAGRIQSWQLYLLAAGVVFFAIWYGWGIVNASTPYSAWFTS